MAANVKMVLACLVELGACHSWSKCHSSQLSSLAAQHTKGVADSSFLWHCSRQTKLALDSNRSKAPYYIQSMLSSWNWRWNPKESMRKALMVRIMIGVFSLISSADFTGSRWGDPNYPTILSSTTFDSSKFASASLRNTKQSSKSD